MRILIVRHGEPNYDTGHLTPKGVKEAKYLSKRLIKEQIDYVYISSLLRAKETAAPYLKMAKKDFVIHDWLQEFNAQVYDELTGKYRRAWDFQADYFASLPYVYDNSRFLDIPIFKDENFNNYYKKVIYNFDKLIEKHGYVRKGNFYEVTNSNKDTIVFFCHLGAGLCLLSRLINIPFPVLAQHFSPLCSSVTCVYTEERKPGVAQFRVSYLGDYSHLTMHKEEPSFAARFRECAFENTRSED